MHICMVMAGDEEGGLEKHVIELANGLIKLKHRVSLIAHEKYRSRVENVQFYSLDLSKSRNNPILLWKLYQTIKSIQADVLHVQANKAVSMIAPMLKWLNVPNVATLHNLKKNIKAFNRYDRIIAVSQRVANQFSSQSKIRVVLNGVKPPDFIINSKSATYPLQAIAIGRLVKAKGFDLLIEAWKEVDAGLWIVGDGPDRQVLQQQIEQTQLSQRIEIWGHRDDINDLLLQSDFLVISSRNEGGPYTLSEALLLKRPVISSDVGMVSQVLLPSMICPANNTQALHQLLQQHIQHFSQLQKDAEPIFHFAQQHLTINAMVEHTARVYQELLDDGHA